MRHARKRLQLSRNHEERKDDEIQRSEDPGIPRRVRARDARSMGATTRFRSTSGFRLRELFSSSLH